MVKELAENETYDDLEKTAEIIVNVFKGTETEKDVYVAYGTVVDEIKEVSRSYKEAQHGVRCRKDLL